MDISSILKNYDTQNITIGVLGGHSALDVCSGAKEHGFNTICIAKKGREKTYNTYYKTNAATGTGCVDEVIVVDEFSDLLNEDVQETLRKKNTIFIHNRYFWTYFHFEDVEKKFFVPIYGSRELLKLEERDQPFNQYHLLEKAGIRIPYIFKTPDLNFSQGSLQLSPTEKPMEKLTLTKVNNAERTYERENFVSSSWEDWQKNAEEKLNSGAISVEGLQNSTIEEFILGAQINFNYFHSITRNTLELLGTDTRRQTNLDGLLRLPAKDQLLLPKNHHPFHIETGHIAVTCKESLLEKAFVAGENFIKACKENSYNLIGPFALQGAIDTNGKSEELIVFDVSFRIPGSPGISATPYSYYLYGKNITMGKRVAMEIEEAVEKNRLGEVLT